MTRTNLRLNSLAITRATKPGYYPDGSGLYLQVTAAQAKSWIYRFALAGRRREMGLGPFPAISLAAARTIAGEARTLVKSGRDPIEARGAERARLRLEAAKGQLFYSFCLADAEPDDHPIREIASVLDLKWVYAELAPHYPRLGRPSVDPVLMLRMLLIGYLFAIRSERALGREVKFNLAYRWFSA